MEATVGLNTANQLNINRDSSVIFIGENTYETVTLENVEETEETILAGTLLGRVTSGSGATVGNVVPLATDATDGSQFPIGVLTETITMAAESEEPVSICVSGKVAVEKIVLPAGDTLNDVISARFLRDRIAADTLGIKLISSTELSGYDNA